MTPDDHAFLYRARDIYVGANAATLTWMLDRPALRGVYLNTKQNSLTLADYTAADGWRGPDFLYGWIQGRGLEALVTHARFFDREQPALAQRLDEAARPLAQNLADIWARDGHAFFAYDRDDSPVFPGPDGRPHRQITDPALFTYSDLFVIKGLIAASRRFAPDALPPALTDMAALVEAIESGRFVMDEQRLLDASALAAQPADYGPRMIALGAAAMLRAWGLDDAASFGKRFLDTVLRGHHDAASGLLRDVPGEDRCSPGHAIELVGFAFEVLPANTDAALVRQLEDVLLHAFQAGFRGPGLCLSVSCQNKAPLSPYFPWWSLPETIRAAALAFHRTRNPASLAVWRAAHEAFFTHYWRADAPLAYQTRTVEGPVDYVPATPDLDPSYHTGLSLLAAVQAIDAIRGEAPDLA